MTPESGSNPDPKHCIKEIAVIPTDPVPMYMKPLLRSLLHLVGGSDTGEEHDGENGGEEDDELTSLEQQLREAYSHSTIRYGTYRYHLSRIRIRTKVVRIRNTYYINTLWHQNMKNIRAVDPH